MMTFKENTEHLDATVYDLDAMELDYNNDNFSIDSTPLDNYRKTYIVMESVINNQWDQAKCQFNNYNLSGNELVGLINDAAIKRIIS
jgi:hypothetical protein